MKLRSHCKLPSGLLTRLRARRQPNFHFSSRGTLGAAPAYVAPSYDYTISPTTTTSNYGISYPSTRNLSTLWNPPPHAPSRSLPFIESPLSAPPDFE